MKFRRRYVLISWDDSPGIRPGDMLQLIENALGRASTPWQRPMLIYADEQGKKLIVRMPHYLIPRFKKLSANAINVADRNVHFHVLHVSGTLRGIRKKLSKIHVRP